MSIPSLEQLLRCGVEKQASDIHIGTGLKPYIRIDSRLIPTDFSPLDENSIFSYIHQMIDAERVEKFKKHLEIDFSYIHPSLGSFRVNLFFQKGNVGAAIRILPAEIWDFSKCGLPENQMRLFASAPNGLVLVTGATGSGKTTTLASMVDCINQRRECHIITIEDPIEFTFRNKLAKVDQREIGRDTQSFSGALRYVLRQDPDVVLIGEMRDIETIETALSIAETGHLVLATLHTSDAIQTVNRVIDVFSDYKQQQIRTTLSFVLNAVLSQRLIPGIDGGRYMASEIMIATSGVRSMIREGKMHQVYSLIQTGRSLGMQTMNQSLAELYLSGKISIEQAMMYSSDVQELKDLTSKGAKP